MVVGPSVRGGRALGHTDEWLKPQPIDLQTGTPSADGVPLHSEHVLRAVAEMVGASNTASRYERDALDALWT